MGIRLTLTLHAYDRMQERGVSKLEIVTVIETGTAIESYPEDTPFPSKLFLGKVHSDPLHVVAAWDGQKEEWIVITVYWPDPRDWEPDNRTRRR
jgi:hypothetical protein